MPGASLWLVPPSGSKVEQILSNLITNVVPSKFPDLGSPPDFPPHLTLTSDVPQDLIEQDPQSWLDSLSITLTEAPSVEFQSLDIGQQFFKKLTLGVSKGPLQSLAAQLRGVVIDDETSAKQWAEAVYAPHVSLLYADVEIDEATRREILHDVDKAGIQLAGEGFLGAGMGEGTNGWSGGRIVVVPTYKELKDWTIVAETEL